MAIKKKKSTKSTRKKSKKLSFTLSQQTKVLLGSFLFLFGLALVFSFISYFFTGQADQSILGDPLNRDLETQNWLSSFGAFLGNLFIYEGFGVSSLIFAFLLTITGVYYFLDYRKKQLVKFWFWGMLVMIWISVFFGFFTSINPLFYGVIGFEINDLLQDYLGFIGAMLVMAFLLIVYLVIRLKFTPDMLAFIFKRTKKDIASDFSTEDLSTETSSEATIDNSLDTSPEIDLSDKEAETNSEEIITDTFKPLDETNFESEEGKELAMEIEEVSEEEPVIKNISEKLVSDFGEFDPKLELSKYKFPNVELLKEYARNTGITINQEELEENKNRIVSTLNNYKIGIASIKATVGPTVTLYEIVPEAGIRISKIKNLEDDIALSLSALGIRIIAPIPGRGTIGIKAPRIEMDAKDFGIGAQILHDLGIHKIKLVSNRVKTKRRVGMIGYGLEIVEHVNF